jgi:HK97 family phage portal protein
MAQHSVSTGRFGQAWRVLRGQAVAFPSDAVKRAARDLWHDGLGGTWGEPPPAAVTATPEHYTRSEAVRAAVDAYANLVAATAFHLFQEDSAGELKELKAHAALAVLETPSGVDDFFTRTDLLRLTVSDLLLSGNAYWFLAGPKRGGGAPQEIWRLNPRLTRIVRSKARYVAGYVTDIDDITIPLEQAEVIHLKLPNPVYDDPFYGLSKLSTAAMAAQTGYEMEKWNRNFFARDFAVPAGVVAIENTISDADFERAKSEWRASYGGKERRTAFVRGGKITFQPIGLSQTDVDFLEGSQWEADKVFQVFGTHHLRLAKFADEKKVNERLFLEGQAWPLLIYLAEKITGSYLPFWGPRRGKGRLVGQFDDVRPRERSLDLSEQQEKAKGLTLNEWRKEQGLEPLDGGDDILFVHVQSGEKVQFEREAMPEPPPPLQPFTQPVGGQTSEEKKPESEARRPEDDQEKAERRESSGGEVGDDIGESANKAVDFDAAHRELRQWEKFTRKRKGTEHERDFVPVHIPAYVAGLIKVALLDCAAPDAVKAVFETASALVDGQLPVAAKSSFGPPDGTVVLYLSGVEDVLLVQQMLQRGAPSGAPLRWTPREQLHMTLVHCPLVDEPDFRTISQEASAFNALPIRVTGLTTFNSPGGAVPIVALVEESDELRALQADVWGSFAARGIAVSEYSNPDVWIPHITLGYAEPSQVAALGLGTGPDFGCTADLLAFTRGDFKLLYSRMAAPVLAALPEVTADAATFKAIQATRLDFEADFEDVLAAARSGSLDRRAWANRTRTLLRKYGEKAYRDGLTDGGVSYGEDEPLDPDDRKELNALLATQSQYVTELGRVLFRTETGVGDAQAALKPELWWNKSVLPLYQAGLISANENALYSWSYNPLKKNCASCIAASKQIHRLREWNQYDLWPNSSVLICGGWLCGCQMTRKTGRAKGNLNAIPLRAAKEHEEGPMFSAWPDGLPDDIKAKFNQVLRHQIQSCEQVDGGPYTLTLREEAGYYAGEINQGEAQRGLTMLDPRLKLVGFELVGDTDLRLNFVVESAEHGNTDTDVS